MPQTKTTTTTVYTIQELEGAARERALEWLAKGNVDGDFWYENVIDDAKKIAALMGIEATDIFFSGFWSQGDGACFVGSYRYAKGSVQAVKDYAPVDTELDRIVIELQKIQRRHFYRLTATVTKHNHRYSHEHTVEIETYLTSPDGRFALTNVSEETQKAVTELLRDFMRWIYRQLEAEYDYHTSEEACIESADANEYTFDAEGRPA